MPPILTGHPDFINYNSTPVPVLVEQLGTFPVNAAWGPITVNVTSGGAYMLSIAPQVGTDTAFTDITVKHLDVAGNVVFTDFFGAIECGAQNLLTLQLPAPTIVRGNVYGSQLAISGLTASSAWLNTVLGVSGFTATGVIVNAYLLPNGIGDPDPKVSNGSALIGSLTGSTPGGLLATLDGISLGPGINTAVYPLVPYSGPAVASIRGNGLSTTPANLHMFINQYTVANGTGSVSAIDLGAAANIVPSEYSINLPACLSTVVWANADGTQTTVVSSSIIADRTA